MSIIRDVSTIAHNKIVARNELALFSVYLQYLSSNLALLMLFFESSSKILRYSIAGMDSNKTFFTVIKPQNNTLYPLVIRDSPAPGWVWFQNSKTGMCINNYTQQFIFRNQCKLHPLLFFIKSTGKVNVTWKGTTVQVPPNEMNIIQLSEYQKFVCTQDVPVKIDIVHQNSQEYSLDNCNKFGLTYAVQQQNCCVAPYGEWFVPQECRCLSWCGDGIFLPQYQQCDDAYESGGCTGMRCILEPGYKCFNKNLSKSQCYKIQGNLSLKEIQKSKFDNKFSLLLQVDPPMNQLKDIDLIKNSRIENNSNILLRDFNYDSNSSLLVLHYEYLESLLSTSIQIQLFPSTSQTQPKSIMESPTVDFNQLSNPPFMTRVYGYYSPEVYSNAQIVKYLVLACMALTYVLLFTGIFTKFKLIAIETFFLYRIAYFTTLGYAQINPITRAMISGLKYSNGFNWRFNYHNSSSALFSIEYSDSLIGNINIMICLLIISGLLYRFMCRRKVKSFFANISIILALLVCTDLGFSFWILLFSRSWFNLGIWIGYAILLAAGWVCLRYSDICNITHEFNFDNFAGIESKRRSYVPTKSLESIIDPRPAELYFYYAIYGFLGVFGCILASVATFLSVGFFIERKINGDSMYKNRSNQMMNLFCFVRNVCVLVVLICGFILFGIDAQALVYLQVAIIIAFTLCSVVAMVGFTLRIKQFGNQNWKAPEVKAEQGQVRAKLEQGFVQREKKVEEDPSKSNLSSANNSLKVEELSD